MSPRLFDRLSSQDAGYLRRESPTQPMHFTIAFAVAPEAGRGLDVEDLRRHLAPRVAATPWLRRKLQRAIGGFGPAVWVDDQRFAVDRHVMPAPVDIAGLSVNDALATLATALLPRDRPLWRLLVQPAEPDGTTTLLLSVHHALSDGGLMQRIMEVMFGPPLTGGPRRRSSVARRVAESKAAVTAYALADRITERLRPVGGANAASGSTPAPRPGIHGPVGPSRVIGVGTISLDDLRALRRSTGATINDLFLTATTAALRDAVAARGLALDDVLALVPRNVRSDQDVDAAGNKTAAMLIPLPLAAATTGDRLRRVQAAAAAAKAEVGSSGNAGFQFDIAVTNVAYGDGHLIGERTVQMGHASVPLQGENRIVAAGTSQNGQFLITYTADGEHFPDVEAIAARTMEEFRRLAREIETPEHVNQL